MSTRDSLHAELKALVVESLNLEDVDPESIGDDDALFGGELGLDSVDALELVLALERRYGIKVQANQVDRTAFASIASLAEFVQRERAGDGPARSDA